jgi:hypothetical protein
MPPYVRLGSKPEPLFSARMSGSAGCRRFGIGCVFFGFLGPKPKPRGLLVEIADGMSLQQRQIDRP